MNNDFYSLETNDILVVPGTTAQIIYSFFDENNQPVDLRDFSCKFFIRHPVTGELLSMVISKTQYGDIVITDFTKEHNDYVTGGRGIFLSNDQQIAGSSFQLAGINEMAILLYAEDTLQFEYGMAYPFEIILNKRSNAIIIAAVSGFLLIQKKVSV